MAATQSQPVPAHEISFSEQNELPKLRSNYGDHVDQTYVGWMRPTPASTPLEEMRHRYETDGYVLVKGLMPRDDILDMREHYFSDLSSTGILAPNTSPRDGIFNISLDPLKNQGLGGEPEDSQWAKLEAAHVNPRYRAFLQHPKLRQFVRDFMGWKKEVLMERAMLRHNVPQSFSTGIHYDHIFLRAGEAEFLTAWIPIGDCDAMGGGLMYLEDSTQLGRDIETDFTKRAKDFTEEERISAFNSHMGRFGFLSHDAEEFQTTYDTGKARWLIANYEAGDVVFHNPWMIHGAAKNEDERNRIRLATDLRFYEDGSAMDKRWMNIWHHEDGL